MVFERRVNYYETDAMRIVHHSNYIRFLEESRIKAMDAMGLPYSESEKCGILIPMLEVECKYKVPAKFDDILLIDTKIKDFNGVRMSVEYVITKKDTNEIVATAVTKHCFTDENLKPVSLKHIKPEWYEKYTKYIGV